MSPRGATFPCVRCGTPQRRRPATGGRHPRPDHLACPRCRYMMYDYPRSCAGTVVLKGDAVLLLKRGHQPKRGWFDLPGGFMEAREMPEAAARRELLEETGLKVARLDWLGFYWDRYYLEGFGYFPTMNFYFIGRWRSGEPRAGDDAAEAEWVPLAQVGRRRSRLAWKHMAEVFRDARRIIAGRRPLASGFGPER